MKFAKIPMATMRDLWDHSKIREKQELENIELSSLSVKNAGKSNLTLLQKDRVNVVHKLKTELLYFLV